MPVGHRSGSRPTAQGLHAAAFEMCAPSSSFTASPAPRTSRRMSKTQLSSLLDEAPPTPVDASNVGLPGPTSTDASSGLDFIDLYQTSGDVARTLYETAVSFQMLTGAARGVLRSEDDTVHPGRFNLKKLTAVRDKVTRNLAPMVALGCAEATAKKRNKFARLLATVRQQQEMATQLGFVDSEGAGALTGVSSGSSGWSLGQNQAALASGAAMAASTVAQSPSVRQRADMDDAPVGSDSDAWAASRHHHQGQGSHSHQGSGAGRHPGWSGGMATDLRTAELQAERAMMALMPAGAQVSSGGADDDAWI
ncbi:hypothetical protein HYH03_014334 [Edaphochlamys debaryana]|uniref:Uncharacterized protein n=1 Tax=Edaphochlamys debaryana TaxID=47281 RepID=A0A836BSC1_9CHLO|nr:hypothetical protein HYH03_014334 [Edaphochlamys debaryana]|eukprot:KAG2487090.1 hypothetical protein HYH03_014334 [Edaphochlamys debaryana]